MSRFSQTFLSNVGRTRALAAVLKNHMASINLAAFALVLGLTVLYIVQINSSVAKGYRIRELENHIHDLTIQNQQMEVATRQVQSLDHVTQSMKMLGMVPSGTPHYVTAADPAFAMAR